ARTLLTRTTELMVFPRRTKKVMFCQPLLPDGTDRHIPARRLGERLRCLLRGHRDLAPADAYAEELPDRDEELELHYCGACGSPVWVKKPRSHVAPHWTSTRENDREAAGVF
ncbi:MAG TPA: hypothetical protein PK867_26220, partial [Pirellulales bacterium]|nr:hypothetical protein [Pirellulales bacterium]